MKYLLNSGAKSLSLVLVSGILSGIAMQAASAASVTTENKNYAAAVAAARSETGSAQKTPDQPTANLSFIRTTAGYAPRTTLRTHLDKR